MCFYIDIKYNFVDLSQYYKINYSQFQGCTLPQGQIIGFAKPNLPTIHDQKPHQLTLAQWVRDEVSGFYEWKHLDGKKIKHITTFTHIFNLAGIWSKWQNRFSFSILTTQATDIMKEIHNTKKKMPLVISNKFRGAWLHDGKLKNTDLLLAKVIEK